MICKKCGNKLIDENSVCSFCSLDSNIKMPVELKNYVMIQKEKIFRLNMWSYINLSLGFILYIVVPLIKAYITSHTDIDIGNGYIFLVLESLGQIMILIGFILYIIYRLSKRNLLKQIRRY